MKLLDRSHYDTELSDHERKMVREETWNILWWCAAALGCRGLLAKRGDVDWQPNSHEEPGKRLS